MARSLQFGLRLRAVRKERGLTQEELAEMIDRSVDAVSNMERGLSLPGSNTLVRLSEQLALPVEILAGWINEQRRPDQERVVLEARLTALTSLLDTRHLRLAIEQVRVLTDFFERSDS